MVANTAAEPMYDVVIVGGGPGGSTTGGFLRRYDPSLRVLILEKEKFPREHVGESQLPPISAVLAELGCWDRVEAANFPIKIGATFTWGMTRTPWDFEFLPLDQIDEHGARPGTFEGWRRQVAFQVDRAIYDKILLDYAAELGCEVREETMVRDILRTGDRIDGIRLANGEVVTGRYYIDASGNAAVLRRSLDVTVEVPTLLKNVAFWDYWENPAWATEIGLGATRIHIRSLPYGWMWFIPIAKTRVSIGVVIPAEHYKQTGLKPAEVYAKAIRDESFIAKVVAPAQRENEVRSTTDWSYVVDRTYGENWFLVGETAGFADPILSAGLTLTQTGARELAYTILELDRGTLDRKWLVERFDEAQRRRVRQHMRFAEYWYSANGIFDDVRENCSEIARDAGLKLNAAAAFQWLAQGGGLGEENPGQVGVGGLDVAGIKQVMSRLSGDKTTWNLNGKNTFKLNLANATETTAAKMRDGRIEKVGCYVRGANRLSLMGMQGMVVEALRVSQDIEEILAYLRERCALEGVPPEHVPLAVNQAMQVLEVMTMDYWVIAGVRKGRPVIELSSPQEGQIFRTHDPEGRTSRSVPAV